jgi:3-methyladenine DNA glycosylase AlkD
VDHPAADRVTLSQPDPVESLVAAVRAAIAEAGDPQRAPGMQAYMKSALPFRGVSAPVLRKVVRPVLDRHPLPDRASWESAVRTLWDEAGFREEWYAAIALTGHRSYRAHQDPATLGLYLHLVRTGAWWDVVDDIAGNRVGPILRAHAGTVTPVVSAWAHDENLWVRRTAILCQLGSGSGTDLALLRGVLEANLADSVHGSEFFIRKAVGWALRQYARTDPDWVRAFVAEHADELSGLSRREALKHLG